MATFLKVPGIHHAERISEEDLAKILAQQALLNPIFFLVDTNHDFRVVHDDHPLSATNCTFAEAENLMLFLLRQAVTV